MNRKQSVLFICLMLAVTTAFSQTNKIDLGAEVGAGRVYLRGNETFNATYKSTIGFNGGFFLQYNFKKNISIRTGISGETKGASVTWELTDHTGKPTTEVKLLTILYYATLPVLIRATFGEKFKFFINGGPYAGYLVMQPDVQSLVMSLGNHTPLKKFDMGLASGLGFSIPIKEKAAFSLEVRHNLGLYNISTLQHIDNYTLKTNSTNLIVSFTRKLGLRTKTRE